MNDKIKNKLVIERKNVHVQKIQDFILHFFLCLAIISMQYVMVTALDFYSVLKERTNDLYWEMFDGGGYNFDADVLQYLSSYKDQMGFAYQNIFGKQPERVSLSSYVNADNNYHAYLPTIDKDFVTALNKDLPQDNKLRQCIDADGDKKLSIEEVKDYFHKFTNGTPELSGDKLESLFLLKNNAISVESLFGDKQSLEYNDVVGKSIISAEDFHKLDLIDGKLDGVIQKDTFDRFNFNANESGIIDGKAYDEGMQRVTDVIEELTDVNRTGPCCNNTTANNDLNHTSVSEPTKNR